MRSSTGIPTGTAPTEETHQRVKVIRVPHEHRSFTVVGAADNRFWWRLPRSPGRMQTHLRDATPRHSADPYVAKSTLEETYGTTSFQDSEQPHPLISGAFRGPPWLSPLCIRCMVVATFGPAGTPYFSIGYKPLMPARRVRMFNKKVGA